MKVSFAIAVFVGLIDAKRHRQVTLQVWGLKSVKDHAEDA